MTQQRKAGWENKDQREKRNRKRMNGIGVTDIRKTEGGGKSWMGKRLKMENWKQKMES